MPTIARWTDLPPNVRQHLLDRMRDRAITISDLNQLRLWIASQPEVPEGDWYKDFGTFKICGKGKFPKTFLLKGQAAKGKPLSRRRLDQTPFLVPFRFLVSAFCFLISSFSANAHVRDKIRQQLQVLRNLGLLTFLGSASYRLI
jgi:hypothetical protein